MILILTHPDVFCEKILGEGISYGRSIDSKIRSPLAHLPPTISLYINSFITEIYQLLKRTQDKSTRFKERSYEFHIVNTFNDRDMSALLDCLCIGPDEKRRCFISSDFEIANFPIRSKYELLKRVQLKQLCDIVVVNK